MRRCAGTRRTRRREAALSAGQRESARACMPAAGLRKRYDPPRDAVLRPARAGPGGFRCFRPGGEFRAEGIKPTGEPTARGHIHRRRPAVPLKRGKRVCHRFARRLIRRAGSGFGLIAILAQSEEREPAPEKTRGPPMGVCKRTRLRGTKPVDSLNLRALCLNRCAAFWEFAQRGCFYVSFSRVAWVGAGKRAFSGSNSRPHFPCSRLSPRSLRPLCRPPAFSRKTPRIRRREEIGAHKARGRPAGASRVMEPGRRCASPASGRWLFCRPGSEQA